MTLKKIDVIKNFVKDHDRFSDYWSMQFAWQVYIDTLCKCHAITQRQYETWGNPCTPETFKRWSNRWYGLRSEV